MTGARSNRMPEAYLYLEDGEDVFRVHLHLNRYLIGSGPENDVCIRDPRVGKRHCSIAYSNGHFSVSARKRAVRVNGRLVAGTQRLDHGTQIDLESNLITFVQVPSVSTIALQLGLKTGNAPPWFMILNRPGIRLGRSACDVRVDDDGIDDVQVEIENYGPNLIFVRATSDRYGTTLNGTALTARRRLRDGDELRFGRTECVVRLLSRSLPRIDEPLEWRPSRGPKRTMPEPAEEEPQWRSPEPHPVVDTTTETTMDPDELQDLAKQVAEIDMRAYIRPETRGPRPGTEAEVEVDEQAAQSTLLVNADQLDRVRAELADARKASRVQSPDPAVGEETLHDQATRTNIPRSAIVRQRPSEPTESIDIERLKREAAQKNRAPTRTQPDPLAYPKPPPAPPPPSRPPRRRPSSGANVVDPGAAKTMAIPIQDIPKPRGPAPTPGSHQPVQESKPLAQPNKGRPVEQPYYLANTDRPREDAVPETVKPGSKAYYLPGQGPGGAAANVPSAKVRGKDGGTLTDMPAVGVDSDEDPDAYYLPEDQRANEVRRRSGADYYEVAEEQREAARRRLRQELGRKEARSDAQHVPNSLLDGTPIDRDFDE